MCLLLIGINAHPDFRLVIAANRDEFYNRSTAPADFWNEAPNLLAGKDLQAGGTWMGITKQGRFAALTNFRDIAAIKENAPSRGHIVSGFLLNNLSANNYTDELSLKGDIYNGYNLVAGDHLQLFYYSNISKEIKKLSDGIYGLSNHLLDTDWYKIRKSKKVFQNILSEKIIDKVKLFSLLTDESRAEDNDLPETGIGFEFEKILSSVFITSPVYGTRSSTIILIDKNRNVTFIERTYNRSSKDYFQNEFNFQIE